MVYNYSVESLLNTKNVLILKTNVRKYHFNENERRNQYCETG